jgi:hypothetical protein
MPNAKSNKDFEVEVVYTKRFTMKGVQDVIACNGIRSQAREVALNILDSNFALLE